MLTIEQANPTLEHHAYWNNEAAFYDSRYSDDWSLLENAFVARSLGWLSRLDSPRVLDLGCGTGLGYELVQNANPDAQYTGVDIATGMLEQLQRKYPETQAIESSMDDLSMFSAESFDAVICFFGSMSCPPSLATVLEQAHRVLTPDGVLRASVLGRKSVRRVSRGVISPSGLYRTRHATVGGPVTVQFYSPREIVKAAEMSGFRVERFDCFGAFADVLEHSKLWPLDKAVSKMFPALAHTHDAILRPI